MSMTEWAENEVRLACNRENPDRKDGEWDYGCACYESALKAYKALMEDDHSGMSFSVTRSILERLLYERPLTPIEDVPESWSDVYDPEHNRRQCVRLPSLIKQVDAEGNVAYHDVERDICIESNGCTSHFGFASRILDEMFPIEMPYYPPKNPYKIYCDLFATSGEPGVFDTVGLYHVITPDGEKVELNRYFEAADDEIGFIEITDLQYNSRKAMYERNIGKEA